MEWQEAPSRVFSPARRRCSVVVSVGKIKLPTLHGGVIVWEFAGRIGIRIARGTRALEFGQYFGSGSRLEASLGGVKTQIR